ncbi:65-kDa microtubule-associated protein 4 [Prunus yedoensis var. nudiflora]|uniref:65-kDa microtubule-associated protein 4 n=1 Tax=Prunus yedoensis var. nudiflora TaxID=2094558 RepID=A0A314YMT3_PRUYE|nr:65-kDa microtubule-associated protein 4 [Prunus yedoensis var. nudiflora]
MFNQRSSNQFVHLETKFEFLLQELQKIWDEVGVPDVERDTMILTIEQECMEVFRTKVDDAKKCKVLLQQAIASYEAELVDICSALGEQPPHFDQNASGSLKKKLETIIPQLEDMKMRKVERRDEFFVVLDQLQKISIQICRSTEDSLYKMVVEETDLSLKRLEELRRQLLEYQDEKRNRVNLVMDHLNILNSLCLVLGMDFKHTIHEIHPTLDDSEGEKDVTNNTVDSLANLIQRLRKVKIQRWQMLQNHASALLEMWNLMDTPIEQQTKFQNVTRHIAASESEITEPNMLSTDFLNHVEEEVSRLQQLKSSKLKEIFQKKRLELEEICRESHMVTETLSAMEYSNEALESGTVDPTCLLEQIELQITRAKEEALSRKEILEKFEKWLAACQEECWLEEYNRDDNRYNAGRGAHLTLKRAEKARALVNKIPGLVEALSSKTTAWEREKGLEFIYDGGRLLSMLTEYSTLRQEKEQEKQRQRDMKRFHGQVLAEQEVLYGSKRSPSRSGKKLPIEKCPWWALIRNQNFEKATPLVTLLRRELSESK